MLMNILAKFGEPVWILADALGDGVWVLMVLALIFAVMYDGPANKPKKTLTLRERFANWRKMIARRMAGRQPKGKIAPWNAEWMTKLPSRT